VEKIGIRTNPGSVSGKTGGKVVSPQKGILIEVLGSNNNHFFFFEFLIILTALRNNQRPPEFRKLLCRFVAREVVILCVVSSLRKKYWDKRKTSHGDVLI
jgi:hypothetical protein